MRESYGVLLAISLVSLPLILIGGVAEGVEAAMFWTVMLAAYFVLVGVLNEAQDADCVHDLPS
jgi:hypothetical protein